MAEEKKQEQHAEPEQPKIMRLTLRYKDGASGAFEHVLRWVRTDGWLIITQANSDTTFVSLADIRMIQETTEK